ncbi:flagellar attachment zone protein 1-like [Pyrus ussuriensis x Pyrus communis]|uniref:Flagellar attachment zone protein 1-like n=1 Tax=Pyrus ussuriensis x Pyrus communis TaxID=2448454 RepID=A0A5N5FKC6_9ROSA|nr:flagellar attachment zone protein 1-like [Pyrus ussuriensis x Pyrus communis]
MDEPSEKLQNLKSLNSLLLKETKDRQQQVESLMQGKADLESKLSRFCRGD